MCLAFFSLLSVSQERVGCQVVGSRVKLTPCYLISNGNITLCITYLKLFSILFYNWNLYCHVVSFPNLFGQTRRIYCYIRVKEQGRIDATLVCNVLSINLYHSFDERFLRFGLYLYCCYLLFHLDTTVGTTFEEVEIHL